MIIRGITASHDGAVAVVEDGRLGFSVANERTQFGKSVTATSLAQRRGPHPS